MMIDLLQFDKRASSYSLNYLITRETESLIDKILMSFAAAVENDGVEKSHDERQRAIKRIAYMMFLEGNA